MFVKSALARTEDGPILSLVPYESCPIRMSLGCLGRKWALPVLYDVAFQRDITFSQILHLNPELTPRVLSMRLRDLQREGLIERLADAADKRKIHYQPSKKGRDAVPILTALIQYSAKYHADKVFEDKKPRELSDLYPDKQEFMLGHLQDFANKNTRRG